MKKTALMCAEKDAEIEQYKQSSLEMALEFKKQKQGLKEKNAQIKASFSEVLGKATELEGENAEIRQRCEMLEKKLH